MSCRKGGDVPMAVPDHEHHDPPSRPDDGVERDLHALPTPASLPDEGQWFPPLIGPRPAKGYYQPLPSNPEQGEDRRQAGGDQPAAYTLPGRPGVPESAGDAVE